MIAGLVAVHRLVRVRSTITRAADLAVWFGALCPFGFAYAMGYPSALFLSATAWAAVAVDRRRWWTAGLLLGLATGLRPNGVTAAIAFTVAVIVAAWQVRDRRGALVIGIKQAVALALPSAILLGVWMGLLVRWTGGPITFLTSKDAWYEVDIIALIRGENLTSWAHVLARAHGRGGDGRRRDVGPAGQRRPGAPSEGVDDDVLVARQAEVTSSEGGVMLRRPDVLPLSWLVFAGTYLAPALFLGVHGSGRYRVELFPILAAGGIISWMVPHGGGAGSWRRRSWR